MDYVGIDLHKKESQIYVLSEGRQLEGMPDPHRAPALRRGAGRAPRARILLEASTESAWVARCLETLGHEVVVADPNFTP